MPDNPPTGVPKIILVEDDDLIRRMYEHAFSFEKYNVQTAANGREGLEKIQKEKPDLVLLDIMMPEMNGLEVLDKLKAEEATKSIPVVILTNLAGDHDAEAAISRGAVKYIIKSEHTPKDIVALVKEILTAYTRYNLPPVT